MKKLLSLLCLCCIFVKGQVNPSFTISSPNGYNSITCSHPYALFICTGNSNLTYTWTSTTTSLTGASVTITIPGNYTVTAKDTLGNSSNQQLTVIMNTLAPNSSITPTLANITCTMTSQVSFTANTTSSNCTQQFLSPFGGTVFSQNATAIYSPGGPGIYSLVTTDNDNGCSVTKQFTISTTFCFPVFVCTSPQNFSVGCNTKSTSVVQITNASPCFGGGAVTYTIIGPTTSTAYSTGTLSTYSVSTPGTWTVIVKDMSNGCETKAPISILQNTTAPDISANVPKQLLDCYTPSVVLQGQSTTPNVSYNWLFPGTPGSILNSSIAVNVNQAAPTSTLIANYTLSITDQNNACKSMSVIPMVQNIFKPNAILSSGGNYTLNAATPTIVLTNMSTSGIPPSTFPTNMPVVGYILCGVPTQTTFMTSSTYTAYTPGTYTLLAKDLNNGCTSTTSLTLIDGNNHVGIQKISSENFYFDVFPNPNNGLITLKTEKVPENSCVKIYNMLGILVKKEDLNTDQKTFDLQNQSNGIYIIQVLNKNKVFYTSRFIKE